MRLYKEKEIENMNYIFGKEKDNNYFTRLELEIASQLDLYDKKITEISKFIWDNKNNENKLKRILKNI